MLSFSVIAALGTMPIRPALKPPPLPFKLVGGLFLFGTSVPQEKKSLAAELQGLTEHALRADPSVTMNLGMGLEVGGIFASATTDDALVINAQITGGNLWAECTAFGAVRDDGSVELIDVKIANMDAAMMGETSLEIVPVNMYSGGEPEREAAAIMDAARVEALNETSSTTTTTVTGRVVPTSRTGVPKMSLLERRRSSSKKVVASGGRSANLASTAEPSFFAPGVRTRGRTLGTLALWSGLLAYVAIGAPGKDAMAQAADAELLAKLIANPFDPTVPPAFACVFSLMGLWPAWYASCLLPGADDQRPVPAAPFLVGSFAFGMFALSPYLALREYRPTADTSRAPLNGVTRWTEGKPNAVLLSASALAVLGLGLAGNDGDLATSAAQYVELFSNQLFVHVTTLDFLALWALSYGVLAEDAKRRGLACPSPLFASVPILGHFAWLLVRPPLPEE